MLVQISSHAGSRRQEAQRLGRILRKKKARPGAGAAPTGGAGDGGDGSGGPAHEEFDAFFYTLVSTDTQEVFFAAKRQRFLVDQGYSYKVVPSLLDAADPGAAAQLPLGSLQERLDLLAAALAASEADASPEELPAGADGLPAGGGGRGGGARRARGSMAALSGGQGLRYLEYATDGKGGEGRGGRGFRGGFRGGPPRGGGAGRLAKFRRMTERAPRDLG